MDGDGDGELNYGEVLEAVGKNKLNLGLDNKDVEAMLKACDRNQDGNVKISEFMRSLDIQGHDTSANYDPFFRLREETSNTLHMVTLAAQKLIATVYLHDLLTI